jgi:hypothetical protein
LILQSFSSPAGLILINLLKATDSGNLWLLTEWNGKEESEKKREKQAAELQAAIFPHFTSLRVATRLGAVMKMKKLASKSHSKSSENGKNPFARASSNIDAEEMKCGKTFFSLYFSPNDNKKRSQRVNTEKSFSKRRNNLKSSPSRRRSYLYNKRADSIFTREKN